MNLLRTKVAWLTNQGTINVEICSIRDMETKISKISTNIRTSIMVFKIRTSEEVEEVVEETEVRGSTSMNLSRITGSKISRGATITKMEDRISTKTR